jgi:predicted nucleotidyltransferase
MSETENQQSLLLERLFSSRVRIRLLTIFLLHPDEQYHIRAIASEVNAQYNAVWKELKNLEEAGLLQSERSAGRKLFRLNPQFPIISELRNILLKTVSAGDLVRNALYGMEGVEQAFIFGSFAEGELDAESDLDLMIIGEVAIGQVAGMVDEVEQMLSREVNYVLFTREEWNARLAADDPLATNIHNSPKVMLIGKQDGL